MEYHEIRIENLTPELKDIVTYYLAEEGFESFLEDNNDLLGYIPSHLFNEENLKTIFIGLELKYSVILIPDQNWNEEWEKNFHPVIIDNRCYIRAPFHPEIPGIEYEIVIMPKMSFGTAHHETTSQMISLMLGLEIRGKKVLDMGCGTGILAILAEKLGATEVLAIDNDNWAYENAIENVQRNNCSKITVKEGEIEELSGTFDVIIANINRNILLNQIQDYSMAAKQGSFLLLSGFYEFDLPVIRECAGENSFRFIRNVSDNQWVAAIFAK